MRLVIVFVAALTAVATSQVAIARVVAQGEAIIELSVGQDDPAREWEVDVAGGSPSIDHLTLAPISLGFRGDVTVAVAGSSATVTLSTVLPVDRELVSVGCLDDRSPPTEIEPVVDLSGFAIDVLPGRRYSCFAASLPIDDPDPAGPISDTTHPADKPLPRSDSSTTPPAPMPGWPAVLITLVAMAGIALLLRPVRRV